MFYFESLRISFPDLIGCLGTLIVLVAYTLLQAKKIDSDSLLYSFLNLIAAIMILISLCYAWNFAAVMMEIAWGMISMYGLVKGILSCKTRLRKRHFENRTA